MTSSHRRASALALLLVATASPLGACTSAPRAARGPAASPPPAAAPAPYALYRGDGRRATLAAVLGEALGADAIFFGELHDHPEGSLAERQVLEGLLAQPRPVTLAMEFFERDTQAAVDAWLAGRIDDATFRTQTKRAPGYDVTHGPLLDLAKQARSPVVAANAPRRLVSAWRKATDVTYADWRRGLPELDRQAVPRRWSAPQDAYWEAFRGLMGDMAAPFFRSQTLWDDAMAESMADARAAEPDRRVLLVVGGFHVDRGLGTVTKFRQRRPRDRVLVIRMSQTGAPGLPFEEEDRGTGDFVVKLPPAEREAPSARNPHAVPAPPPQP